MRDIEKIPQLRSYVRRNHFCHIISMEMFLILASKTNVDSVRSGRVAKENSRYEKDEEFWKTVSM